MVLSASETGLVAGYEGGTQEMLDSRFPLGDDLVGLQRAFLQQGASSVLSTLWKVEDESTSRLVVEFFKDYLAQSSKVSCLRQAQLALLNVPQWSRPFYWAPFSLSGDWR